MSNIKIRFTVLKSNLLTSFIILIFLVTLSHFSRSLYDISELSVPYEYTFLALILLIVVIVMSILLNLTYIFVSEPFRSLDETNNSVDLLSYLFDRLFHTTNPREYEKAIELGMK